MNRLTPAVKNIILINVFLLLITSLRPGLQHIFALYYPTSPFFHFWQPITYMFMHGGFAHLFFNMFALFMFGVQLESVWGTKKFLLFYFITGLGAAACHLAVQWFQIQHNIDIIADGGLAAQQAMTQIELIKHIPTVGASGSVYGILIGFAMLFPDVRLTLIFPPVSLTAKWWVVVWIVIEMVTGVLSFDNVAHFAHLGGMLFGFLLIKLWKKQGKMYENRF